MGLPSKKRTNRSKRERAAHFALKKITIGKCEKCNSAILPHHVCQNCGNYRGKQIMNVEKRATRKQRRDKRIR